jgi:tetratricopeptide (TPR) repeat protein
MGEEAMVRANGRPAFDRVARVVHERLDPGAVMVGVSSLSSILRRRSALLRQLVLPLALMAAAPALARQASLSELPNSVYTPADSLEGNFLAAYIAGASRDTSAAALFYREALRDDPKNPELLERAFLALLADGDLAAAGRAAEKVAQRNPGNGLAQLTLGVRSFKNKQYSQARTFLGQGSRGRAADLTSTLLTAWSWAGSRDGKRALEVVGGVRGERGFAVFRDYHAGLIADLVGNQAEAERRLKSAYDADKTTLRIVQAYARSLARHGQVQEAIEILRGYDATVAQRHPLIKTDLEALTAGRNLPPLIGSAQEGAAEVLYGLGSAGIQQGDELASIVYLRLALQLDPEHALALITLADNFERLKRVDVAMETLKRIPANSPLRPMADIQVGLSLEQLGRGEEAVATLERLMKQRPDDNDVIVALGNVLRSRKKFDEAAEIYGRAIARLKEGDPGLWPLYYYRGTAYERAKQWPKAEADLKKALELVPDTQPIGKSQVLNYLGYSWVDMATNLDEAFKMLKRAVELNPRDGMIIDSLGWGYYRFGHYEDAVRELEKAAEVKAGDPVINDHLGDAYWKVGRKLEARFQWQHAKDSEPEPDDLKKIEAKLAGGLPEDERATEAKSNGAGVKSDAEPANGG